VRFTGAALSLIKFNFGDPTADGGTGLSGLTSFGAPSELTSQGANGRDCLLSP
jgi:hypothetical protein